MTNKQFLSMVQNYKNLDSIDKIVLRSGWKPRIYGVHQAAFKSSPGVSILNHYVKHNPDYAKVLIREELECIKILRGRIKL